MKPESDPPDADVVERELTALEAVVGHLLAELEAARRRADEAEVEHGKLRRLLVESRVSKLDPAALEARLRELTEENTRLREVIEAGRDRAERIRSRLIVMEDETSGGAAG